jgi:hypothetical protein
MKGVKHLNQCIEMRFFSESYFIFCSGCCSSLLSATDFIFSITESAESASKRKLEDR